MKIESILCYIIFMLSITYPKTAYSWNENVTHRLISAYAADLSILGKNLRCLNNLGFDAGLRSPLTWNNSKSIREWLTEGAEREDMFPRWMNHFHNPIEEWSNAGLFKNNTFWASALFWAQDWKSESSGALQSSDDNWSWKKIREYYYGAFINNLRAHRAMYFAQMFRGLGNQMHLLQDMAVPYHVRNDAHPSNSTFEKQCDPSSASYSRDCGLFESWVKYNYISIEELKNSFSQIIHPERTAFEKPEDHGVVYNSLIPITVLSDAGMYDGSNPSANGQLGLAEYTNANFVSDDTIFADTKALPYPKKGSTNLAYYLNNGMLSETIVAEDNVPDVAFWIKKTTDGEVVDHFLKPGYLTNDMNNNVGVTHVYNLTFTLDDMCNKDYAERLLPRAVGYSAALIDYFFRGQLGISFAPGGVKIKNVSKEEIAYYQDPTTGDTVGSIGVYFDDSNNERHHLNTYDLAASETPILRPGQETGLVSFATPTTNIKKNRYIIVFKGKLGNEEGAVVGRVYVPTVYYFSRVDNVDKIARVEMDGSNPSIVVDAVLSNLYLGRFSFSPDGNAVVFENMKQFGELNSNIIHLDLATGNLTWLAEGNAPDWSPDGATIVYSRDLHRVGDVADEQLFTHHLASGAETQLTDVPYAGHYDPSWSPDGTKIAYAWTNSIASNCTNNMTINVMTASGTTKTPVTCSTGANYIDREPAWSPDGTAIAFVRRSEGATASQLHRATLKTMPAVISQLTTSNVVDRAPAWSPDGSEIAIGTSPTPDGNYDVHLVNAQTGEFIKSLTEANLETDSMPVFGK